MNSGWLFRAAGPRDAFAATAGWVCGLGLEVFGEYVVWRRVALRRWAWVAWHVWD